MPNPMFQTLLTLALQNKFRQEEEDRRQAFELEKQNRAFSQQEEGWGNILQRQQDMKKLELDMEKQRSTEGGQNFMPALNAHLQSTYGPESVIPEDQASLITNFASKIPIKDQRELYSSIADAHKAAYQADQATKNPQFKAYFDPEEGINKIGAFTYDPKTKKANFQDMNKYDSLTEAQQDARLLSQLRSGGEIKNPRQLARAKQLNAKYEDSITKMVTTQNTDPIGGQTTSVTAARAPEIPGGKYTTSPVAQGVREPSLLTKGSLEEVEKKIMAERDLEDQLLEIKDKSQDKFLTYGGGWEAFARRIYGKMFNPKEKDKYLSEYTAWKSDVMAMENDYLHMQTGAQRSIAEIKWLADAIANPNVSPIEFSTRLNAMINASRRRRTRHEEYKDKGLSGEHMNRRVKSGEEGGGLDIDSVSRQLYPERYKNE